MAVFSVHHLDYKHSSSESTEVTPVPCQPPHCRHMSLRIMGIRALSLYIYTHMKLAREVEQSLSCLIRQVNT